MKHKHSKDEKSAIIDLLNKRIGTTVRQISRIAIKHKINNLRDRCNDILEPTWSRRWYEIDVQNTEIGWHEYFDFAALNALVDDLLHEQCMETQTADLEIECSSCDIAMRAALEYRDIQIIIQKLNAPEAVLHRLKSKEAELWYGLETWDNCKRNQYNDAVLLLLDEQAGQEMYPKAATEKNEGNGLAVGIKILAAAMKIDPAKLRTASSMKTEVSESFRVNRRTTTHKSLDGKRSIRRDTSFIPKGYKPSNVYRVMKDNGWP